MHIGEYWFQYYLILPEQLADEVRVFGSLSQPAKKEKKKLEICVLEGKKEILLFHVSLRLNATFSTQ